MMNEAAERNTCPSAELDEAIAAAMDRLGEPRELTVLLNDPQRHTDSRAVLERLAHERDIAHLRILVATGTHRFGRDQRGTFEKPLAGLPIEELAWHDCSGDLVSIGGTWRGHPWLIEPPGLLAIGSVEPHYFAGFTGAHKTLTVGCASRADIESSHAHAMNPCARPVRLGGNPVFEAIAEMLEALARSRPIAAINLVQRGRQILKAEGGEPLGTLHRLAPVARKAFVRELPHPADVIVAEVTGALASSFYQADKGIKNCEWAVRDGGAIVLLAACPDGIGQNHFVSLLREAPTASEALRAVNQRGYRLGDHKAVRLRQLTDPGGRNVRVYLVSDGVSADEARVLGLIPAGDEREALAMARVAPDRHRVVRVSDAGNVHLTCPGLHATGEEPPTYP
jgi:lactate racemase